jgi:hypothetical protein
MSACGGMALSEVTMVVDSISALEMFSGGSLFPENVRKSFRAAIRLEERRRGNGTMRYEMPKIYRRHRLTPNKIRSSGLRPWGGISGI